MSALKDKELIGLAKKKDDIPVELESQYILRLPAEPAQELRKSLRSGVMNVKDRLSVHLENDMRHGIVRFDKWVFSAKLMDLPCVTESLKTIDRKTFYKVADICQILICKEEDDSQTTEEEESPKKKEDGKTEKKFLYPHGVTPPLKNVRKRRFRKTLKKKYVDAPETEKEVKRLFRVDNDAVNVRWEVITDEDDPNKKPMTAEHDIFGEEVSSSEEEHDVNIMDSGDDESSRLSAGVPLQEMSGKREYMSEFAKEILQRREYSRGAGRMKEDYPSTSNQDHIMTALEDAGLVKQELGMEEQEALMEKREEIQQQLLDLQARRRAQELEIGSIENQALKQRFQSILDSLIEEENEKKQQKKRIDALLETVR